VGYNTLGLQTYTNGNTPYDARNTAVGYAALFYNSPNSTSTGTDNTAIGAQALYENSTGYDNTALGVSALFNNSTGYGNTAVGLACLNDLTTGDYNTALGYNAGPTSTYPALNNTSCIGNGAAVTASNNIRIGNSSITSISGQVGFSYPSDGRFKNDIREDIPGLGFVMQLRPLSYYFDAHSYNDFLGIEDDTDWEGKYDIEKIRFSGFIAQDVEKAAQNIGYDFSGIDKTGTTLGLRYSEFVVPLVKAIQEQQDIILTQQKMIEEMGRRLEALEKR
jgi:hypothetical protein